MKTKATAAVLAFFLGCWGIHRFYVGDKKNGLIMAIIGVVGLFAWIPLLVTGVWALVDLIKYLSMSDADFQTMVTQNFSMSNGNYQPTYQTPQQSVQQAANTNDAKSKTEKLTELKQLMDDGVLTQEEFNAEKAKILNA